MKRLVVVALVVGLAAAVLCLGATESLTNHSGKTASGVVLTFSESVRITSYDQAVFPNQEPTGRAETFTFSGGELPNGGRFKVTWTPSSAEITSSEWIAATTPPAAEVAVPMGFAATTATPVVAGSILNPAYFAHAAYVMQGVSDRDKVFSLPLSGVPELAFLPTAAGVDPASVTWSLQTSHPEGIGAAITDDTLYIWGSNATWAGYGAVTLSAAVANASGSVTIPVTVFRTDKTLINSEGKKDYFVPWSPQLDINRSRSVEEHMRKYNKDEGALDRSIRWSRWREMGQLKDVQVIKWCDSFVWGGWSQTSQFALVDALLDEIARLGARTVRFELTYYLPTAASNDIVPVYIYANNGPSLTPDEVAYVVNEAHRRGLGILLTDFVWVNSGPPPGVPRELGEIALSDRELFWSNYKVLVLDSLAAWSQLGVEYAGIDTVTYTLPNTADNRIYTNSQLQELGGAARGVFSGPLVFVTGGPWPGWFPPWNSNLEAPFWAACDILCCGISLNGLDPLPPSDGTDQRLLDRWSRWIKTYFQPFQERFNKPFIANENTCFALEGAAVYGAYYNFQPPQPGVPIDIAEMARYFSLQGQAFSNMVGYYGPGLWTFVLNPGYDGGIRDANFDLHLKIDDLIREMFGGPADTETIHIDGSVDDWSAAAFLGSDSRGDVGKGGADDILALYGAESDLYYYIRLDYAQPPNGTQIIDLDTDGDWIPEVAVSCTNRWTSNHRWTASLETPAGAPRECIGVVDAVDAGRSLEMRIAKRFLPSASGRIAILSVQDYDEANGNVWAIVSDEMHGVFEIPRLP